LIGVYSSFKQEAYKFLNSAAHLPLFLGVFRFSHETVSLMLPNHNSDARRNSHKIIMIAYLYKVIPLYLDRNKTIYSVLALACNSVTSFGVINKIRTHDYPDGAAKISWDNLMRRDLNPRSKQATLKSLISCISIPVLMMKISMIGQRYSNNNNPKQYQN
jgi:hypothetical protein